MLEKGSLVVYSNEGVCEIIDIEQKSFIGMAEKKEYYVLKSRENTSSKLYIPLDNELLCSKIKKLINYEELIELINNSDENIDWIDDNKLRSKYYKDIFNSYDRPKLFSLAKSLHKIKTEKSMVHKKLYSIDEDALKRLSQLLYSELTYIVDITPEQVLPYICGEITCEKRK